MGREVSPGATLTICGVWGDMVDVITCAIFGNCRLRGVGVVRGISLPSPIDLTRRCSLRQHSAGYNYAAASQPPEPIA